MHPVKQPNDEAQKITLVVVAMPDRNVAFLAQANGFADDTHIQRTSIVDANDSRAGRGGTRFQSSEPYITAWPHEHTGGLNAILFKESR
jgi:hypothetical protein